MPDRNWVMGALAAQDAYQPVPEGADPYYAVRDPSELAAQRVRQNYRNLPEPGSSPLPRLALDAVDFMVPSSPADFALMAMTGGPLGRGVAKVGGKGLQMGLGALGLYGQGVDDAEAGKLDVAKKAMGSILSMDEASRLSRANEQGFTRDVFRGEGRPIEGSSFVERHPGRYDPGFLGGDAIYATNRPHLANDYAMLKAAREFDNGAPNVMPLKLKMENPHVISADDKRRIAAMDRWDRDAWLRDEVYGKGHDGVIVKYGDGNPARRSSGYEEYVAPAASYRSRFAAFDPKKIKSSDLLASIALLAPIGMGALVAQDRYEDGR